MKWRAGIETDSRGSQSILGICFQADPIIIPNQNEAGTLQQLKLNRFQQCDLEMILNGGFSPLSGFLGRDDYNRVLEEMRLSSGALWPIPICLDVPESTARLLGSASELMLSDQTGRALAILEISDVWKPDKTLEAARVFQTESMDHPGVRQLMSSRDDWYVGGELKMLDMPMYYSYPEFRASAPEIRRQLGNLKAPSVVGFQTRNPMHRAHVEITKLALEETGGHLLLQPVTGITKPGDVAPDIRSRCYLKVLDEYPEGRVTLNFLPLAMRMAGPREALWHAIIRKNFGCTHFIVGRDHAGPGPDSNGNLFYGPYDAQRLVRQHEQELGIGLLSYPAMVFSPSQGGYVSLEDAKANGWEFETISGTQFRRMLSSREPIPSWFSFESVVQELRKGGRQERGIVLFLAGLSGSGKSTVASKLAARIESETGRAVSLLDGDIVREGLSKGLGFSKEDRSTNVRRVGFVAAEIAKHGGIAICALVAPYQEDRRAVKDMVISHGHFLEVHVATPLEVCEERDVKGLYARARQGELTGFTGIDDPFEIPVAPDVTLDTSVLSSDEW